MKKRASEKDETHLEEITDISEDILDADVISDEMEGGATPPSSPKRKRGDGESSHDVVIEDLTGYREGVAEPHPVDDDFAGTDFDIESLSSQVDQRTRIRPVEEQLQIARAHQSHEPGESAIHVIDGEHAGDEHRFDREPIDESISAPPSRAETLKSVDITLSADEMDNLDIDLVETGEVSSGEAKTVELPAVEKDHGPQLTIQDRSGSAKTEERGIETLDIGEIKILDEDVGEDIRSLDKRKIDRFNDEEIESFLAGDTSGGGRIGDELEFDFDDDERRLDGDRERRIIDEGITDPHGHEKTETEHGSGGRKNRITIELDNEVSERLPDDFDMTQVGTIDLREAEEIANEEVIFLTEEDLIEELEDMDLVFLEENGLLEEESIKKDIHSENEPSRDFSSLAHSARSVGAQEVDGGSSENLGETQESPVEEVLLNAAGEEVSDHLDLHGSDPGVRRARTLGEMQAELSKESLDGSAPGAAGRAHGVQNDDVLSELETYTGSDFDVVFESIDGEKPLTRTSGHRDSSAGESGKSGLEFTDASAGREIQPGAPSRIIRAERDHVPLEIAALANKYPGIRVIDDALVDHDGENRTDEIFEHNELERITSDIIEVVESDARLLDEASVSEDQVNIASIMKGSAPAFEDLLIDFEDEYQFVDNELKFIDSAIMDDVRKNGFSEIERYSESRMKRLTHAVEIIGLTRDEIGTIEDNVFIKEYGDIDFAQFARSGAAGLDQPVVDLEMVRDCFYLLPREDSLRQDERASIEEDICVGRAYIFEEDVEDIRHKLHELKRDRDNAGKEQVVDVSSDVVFIDNAQDVDRFIETLPAAKRDDMRKLLHYLDGLFEKLPEEVVQKFAESEYFSLYQEVLKEIGL